MNVRRFVIFCLLLSALPLLAVKPPGEVVGSKSDNKDDESSQASTSTLEKEADRLVSQRNYEKAVPLLQELANRLGSTESPQLLQKLERILFHLGVGQMETGNIEPAVEAFTKYMEKFPKDSHARYALQLLGDCQRRLEKYEEAAAAYERLRNEYTLEYQFQSDVMTKLADCYVFMSDWDKALPLLDSIWKELRDPEARARAATALAQGYIEKGRVDDILELLPVLQSRASRARYEAEFNLTLIRGADSMFNKKRFPMALLLYQLAFTKEDLLRYYDQREVRLKEQRKASVAAGEEFQKVLDVDEELQRLKVQREALNEAESYTEELRFRLAKTYYELGRQWESFWTFWGLWRDFPKTELGEQGLYAAFSLAAELDLYGRACELGNAFMKDYEKGENLDELTLTFGQLHIKHKEFDKAMEVFQKALTLKPDHAYADQIAFQMGYCYFQKEDFDKALGVFTEFRKKTKDSETREAADYWVGLTYMFKKDYKSANEEFSEFLEKYMSGDYVEDATFRIGVCDYGLLQFPAARQHLEEFIRKFPDSKLRGEAHTMLGDIAGAESRLNDAIVAFKEVERHTTNQSQIDYAAFQIGRIQELRKDWTGMVDYFQRYLRTYELKGLYTEAIWRIGFAKKQLGDVKGMLDEYWTAIKKYGNDPGAGGVDLILKDWIKPYQSATGKDPEALLRNELAEAESQNQRAMALRMKMGISLIDSNAPAPTVKEEDLVYASPAVLVWIGEKVQGQQLDLARKAFQRVLEVYGGTEWIESAMMDCAEIEATAKDFKKAADLFGQVNDRFPTSERAGLALKRKADMLREQRKYKEAIALYEKILQVREYRGPLWPESLYQIGMCRLQQGEVREAFAFFQRIYVLYGNYADWTARAYLQSAICLEKLNQRQDAIKTYGEMLAKEKLKKTPEYQEAEKRLAKLQ